MTRVLVTGVAGFIGAHVAEHCIKQGFTVVGVDDLSGGFIENIPDGVDFRRGDITDYKFLESLWLEEKFDYVYHLAAYAAEGLSHFIRRYNYANNLIGSINLINLSIINKVSCFVFTSSIAVYGTNQTPMTESLIPMPEDPYGISKYAVELDLKAAHEMFGLNYVIFRPHNVYGEKQNIADKYRNVIGIFMNQVLNNKRMSIFGDGEQTRAFSHIDDVAPIIAKAPLVDSAYNETFNIGADRPYSVNELTRVISGVFNVELNVEHLPARNEVVDAYATHDKLKNVFLTKPPIELEDGVSKMAKWVKSRSSMTPVEFNDIEILENLPPSWHPRVDNG